MSYEYRLDPARDRFGSYVRRAYHQESIARLMRDYLLERLRDGKLDALLLSNLEGTSDLPRSVVENAAINVIDYLMEPLIIGSMPDKQLVDYIRRVRSVWTFGPIAGIDRTAPLLISTLHHACTFSVIAEIATELLREHGYRRFVLLHSGEQHEMHIAILNLFMLNVLDVQADYFLLGDVPDEAWMQGLDPDTAIFYFVDTPKRKSEGRLEIISTSDLKHAADYAVNIDISSFSDDTVKKFSATQFVIDYPEGNSVRVVPFKADAPVLHCPLQDWVLWPLLHPCHT